MDRLPSLLDRDAPIFTISTAARLAGMHPQTLRQYDRLGLVSPRRARGRGRRYSPAEVTRLRLVQYLSQTEGINLPGIHRILALQMELERAQRELLELSSLLRQQRAEAGHPRLFTADVSGGVDLGRRRARLELGR